LTSLCLLLGGTLLLGSRLFILLDSFFRLFGGFLDRLRGSLSRLLSIVGLFLRLDNLLRLGCLARFGGSLFLLLLRSGLGFGLRGSLRVGDWGGLLCPGRLSGRLSRNVSLLRLDGLLALGGLLGSRGSNGCFSLIDIRWFLGLDLSALCGLSSRFHGVVDVGSLLCLDRLLVLGGLLLRSRLDIGLFGVGILSLDCLLSSGLLRWGSLSFFVVGVGLLATALLGSGFRSGGTGGVSICSFGGLW